MKKKLAIIGLLFAANLAQANASTVAVQSQANSQDALLLKISVNNKSNVEIVTDSDLVPDHAKHIEATSAAFFDLQLPNEKGSRFIRYSQGSHGCYFYIDTTYPIPDYPQVTITSVAMDYFTTCDANTIGDSTHLAISFHPD